MNILEARKLGHEGWVRSQTRTNEQWVKVQYDLHPEGCYMTLIKGISGAVTGVRAMNDKDLDAEDWEPKPAPAKPFEAEVLVNEAGVGVFWSLTQMGIASGTPAGWRKIRVREVSPPEVSSPAPAAPSVPASAPAADKAVRKVWSNSKQAFVEGDVCHKCGGVYADYWCCSTALGGS